MLYVLFGRGYSCKLLGFTKREGFLDWLRSCLYSDGFTGDITHTSSALVVMGFYIVLKFVSRRVQDLDFSATRFLLCLQCSYTCRGNAMVPRKWSV